MLIDLHVHSCYSKDSLSRPKELIAWMQRRGLDRIAITDHDAIEGALQAARLAPDAAIALPGELAGRLLALVDELAPRITEGFAARNRVVQTLRGGLGLMRAFGGRLEIFVGSVLAGDNADAPSAYDFALGGAGMDPSLPVGSCGAPLLPGTTVMADVSGNFTGYVSDCSRTYAVGAVPARVRRAHDVSIAICEAIAAAGVPGARCDALYALALQRAEAAGLSDHFMGFTQRAKFVGHGVGLEINELPVLAARSEMTLAADMTLALEPKFVFPGVGAVGIETAVFERLKSLRRDLAAERGVPAYVVFSDATLLEMAAYKPRTLGQLAAISGVGPTKLARYGDAFLAALNESV